MSDPLLHVLVLNWNGREHIEACLASVLESSYGNLAVILVDAAGEQRPVDHRHCSILAQPAAATTSGSRTSSPLRLDSLHCLSPSFWRAIIGHYSTLIGS